MGVIIGIRYGLDFLEQVFHCVHRENSAEISQAIVDYMANRLVLALHRKRELRSAACTRKLTTYDGCAPHEVNVMILDLVLNGEELGNVDCSFEQLLMN